MYSAYICDTLTYIICTYYMFSYVFLMASRATTVGQLSIENTEVSISPIYTLMCEIPTTITRTLLYF